MWLSSDKAVCDMYLPHGNRIFLSKIDVILPRVQLETTSDKTLTLIGVTSGRPSRCGGGSSSPPYLSQPFMGRFSKFFCLVKACENLHWFLFHKWLPIVHRLAARRRRSGEGQSRQYFRAKNSKFSIFSYKYVIYLKWKLKLCRIQIHDKTIWFVSEKLEKSLFFSFCLKNEADQVSSTANFSNFFVTKLKNGLTRSCKKVWS